MPQPLNSGVSLAMSCQIFGTGRHHAFRIHASRACRSTSLFSAAPRWSSTDARKWSTPLAKELAEAITTTGPIPIASYMRQCLTSPTGGYYTTHRQSPNSTTATDQFGKTGDFVTSPEISQIFGELVGIFFVAEWLAQGQPAAAQLIELGPGRGTLMSDILRAIVNFRQMADKLESIWLVEASPVLRNTQKQLLCGAEAEMQETERGWTSITKTGHSISWVEDLTFLPKSANKTPFIVAHEFFDALPIHAFESVPGGPPSRSSNITTSTASQPARPQSAFSSPVSNEWRELLVSPTRPPSVIDPPREATPDFELTLSKSPTRHSSYLPALSQRYKSLLSHANSSIEISPESLSIMSTLAQLIGGSSASSPPPAASQLRRPRPDAPPSETTVGRKKRPSGAALIIDYGPASTVPVNSLRGIKAHRRVSPFVDAGNVDLSTDVDFGALAEAALEASEGVEVHGPVEQGAWLQGLGGEERVKVLARKAEQQQQQQQQQGEEDVKGRIEGGWKRLVDRGPNGMGRVYKVLAVIPYHGAVGGGQGEAGGALRRPVGFGGDVGA